MTEKEREEIKIRMEKALEKARKEAAEKRANMTPEELEALKQASRNHAAKVRDEIMTGYAIDQRKKLEKIIEDFQSDRYQKEKVQEKYQILEAALNIIESSLNTGMITLGDLMIEVFRRIYWLGYEIGHNKATEMLATDFHKPLVERAVGIVKSFPNPYGDMTLPLKIAMVYEYDKEKKKELEEDIHKIESQM